MVWALILLLLLSPVNAYAEEEQQTEQQIVVETDTTAIETKLDTLNTTVNQRFDKLDQTLNKPEEVKTDDSQELDTLISIDEHLTQLVGENTSAGIQAQTPLLTVSNASFVAYNNVSPTSQWAQYSIQMLPKLDWNEHYCYLQDTSSSYVFVHGPLVLDAQGNMSGDNCTWRRWYYASNSMGYQMESGNGHVGITTGNYTVLSDLGTYPILGDGTDGFRREVMYYAVVAVVVFSLLHVWRFVLRNSQPFKGIG